MNDVARRSGAIDTVRVLGIAAVVAGHTWGIPLVRPLFYSWHVPLFFFLAGYFWSEHRSLKTAIGKRTWTLAVPSLTWFVLIGLVFVPVDSTLGQFTPHRLFGPFVNGVNSAMPYTTFWFVSVLFVTVILVRILGVLPIAAQWVIAIGGSAAGVLAGSVLAQTPLSIGSALACMIFVMVGRLAKKLRPHVTRPGIVGLALILLSATLVVAGFSAPVDIKQGDYGTPGLSVLVASALSFALILIAEVIFGHLPTAIHRGATQLASAGLAVILLHPLVFWLMLNFTPGAGHWIIFAVTILTSWFVGLAALRTPASRWLTGVPPDVMRRAIDQSASSR